MARLQLDFHHAYSVDPPPLPDCAGIVGRCFHSADADCPLLQSLIFSTPAPTESLAGRSLREQIALEHSGKLISQVIVEIFRFCVKGHALTSGDNQLRGRIDVLHA